jgi:hypothetical protein
VHLLLSVCPCVSVSLSVSVFVTFCVSLCRYVCDSVTLCVCLAGLLAACVCLSVSVSVSVSVCLCLCLYLCLCLSFGSCLLCLVCVVSLYVGVVCVLFDSALNLHRCVLRHPVHPITLLCLPQSLGKHIPSEKYEPNVGVHTCDKSNCMHYASRTNM